VNCIRPWRRALSGVDRSEVPLGSQFYARQFPCLRRRWNSTIQSSTSAPVAVESLRRAREYSPRNFAFNDVHRKLIYEVRQAITAPECVSQEARRQGKSG